MMTLNRQMKDLLSLSSLITTDANVISFIVLLNVDDVQLRTKVFDSKAIGWQRVSVDSLPLDGHLWTTTESDETIKRMLLPLPTRDMYVTKQQQQTQINRNPKHVQ